MIGRHPIFDANIREHAKLLDVGTAHRIKRAVIERGHDRSGVRRRPLDFRTPQDVFDVSVNLSKTTLLSPPTEISDGRLQLAYRDGGNFSAALGLPLTVCERSST
jgi:hypothetical protein